MSETMRTAKIDVFGGRESKVRPIVDETCMLEHAAEAFDRMRRRYSIGKVIITPSGVRTRI